VDPGDGSQVRVTLAGGSAIGSGSKPAKETCGAGAGAGIGLEGPMVSWGQKPRGILLRRPLIRWFSRPRLVSPGWKVEAARALGQVTEHGEALAMDLATKVSE
jgi:hypothetical protein